jgi:hypothetical protein
MVFTVYGVTERTSGENQSNYDPTTSMASGYAQYVITTITNNYGHTVNFWQRET